MMRRDPKTGLWLISDLSPPHRNSPNAHPGLLAGKEDVANKGVPNGYAPLDANGELQAHEGTHTLGGNDAFLSTDYLDAIVYRLWESGDDILVMGAVPDGKFLKRSGLGIVGEDPAVIDHDNLTNVTTDQHHAELFVDSFILRDVAVNKPAAGWVGKIYIETDGSFVVWRDNGATWDEIARGEAGIRLAELAEKSHGSLTDVGEDDHHAKVHSTGEHDAYVPVINSGSYSGDDTTGRAIAHGCGRIPKMVWFSAQGGKNIWYLTPPGGDTVLYLEVTTSSEGNYTQNTPTDATNFYANGGTNGYLLNKSGITYYWVAIG